MSPTGTSPNVGTGRRQAVFVFDGDCAFCSSCARFIERHIPTSAAVAAWQHVDLEELGLTQPEVEDAVQWVPADSLGRHATGPEAIARLLTDAGSYWRPLGWLLSLPPVRWLAWPVYRLVSRNRHRLPGGTAACALPQAQRDRLRAGTDGVEPSE